MTGKRNIQIMIPVVILFVIIVIYTLSMISGIEGIDAGEGSHFSKDPQSYYIFYQLFKQLGYQVKRQNYLNLTNIQGCIVLFQYQQSDEDYLKKLSEWVSKGNTLFLFGVDTEEDPLFHYPIQEGDYSEMIIHQPYHQDMQSLEWKKGRFLTETDGKEIISMEKGVIGILEEMGKGKVFLFPEGSLFINEALKKEAPAIFLNNVFKSYYQEKIYFIKNKAKYIRYVNPIMVLFRGRLFFLTFHLILCGIVFILWKGIRFGNSIILNPYYRRTLTEHLQGVGNFYEKGRAIHMVDKIDRDYFLFKVNQHFSVSHSNSLDQIVNKIAEYLKINPEKIKKLLSEEKLTRDDQILRRKKQRDHIYSQLNKYFMKQRNK